MARKIPVNSIENLELVRGQAKSSFDQVLSALKKVISEGDDFALDTDIFNDMVKSTNLSKGKVKKLVTQYFLLTSELSDPSLFLDDAGEVVTSEVDKLMRRTKDIRELLESKLPKDREQLKVIQLAAKNSLGKEAVQGKNLEEAVKLMSNKMGTQAQKLWSTTDDKSLQYGTSLDAEVGNTESQITRGDLIPDESAVDPSEAADAKIRAAENIAPEEELNLRSRKQDLSGGKPPAVKALLYGHKDANGKIAERMAPMRRVHQSAKQATVNIKAAIKQAKRAGYTELVAELEGELADIQSQISTFADELLNNGEVPGPEQIDEFSAKAVSMEEDFKIRGKEYSSTNLEKILKEQKAAARVAVKEATKPKVGDQTLELFERLGIKEPVTPEEGVDAYRKISAQLNKDRAELESFISETKGTPNSAANRKLAESQLKRVENAIETLKKSKAGNLTEIITDKKLHTYLNGLERGTREILGTVQGSVAERAASAEKALAEGWSKFGGATNRGGAVEFLRTRVEGLRQTVAQGSTRLGGTAARTKLGKMLPKLEDVYRKITSGRWADKTMIKQADKLLKELEVAGRLSGGAQAQLSKKQAGVWIEKIWKSLTKNQTIPKNVTADIIAELGNVQNLDPGLADKMSRIKTAFENLQTAGEAPTSFLGKAKKFAGITEPTFSPEVFAGLDPQEQAKILREALAGKTPEEIAALRPQLEKLMKTRTKKELPGLLGKAAKFHGKHPLISGVGGAVAFEVVSKLMDVGLDRLDPESEHNMLERASQKTSKDYMIDMMNQEAQAKRMAQMSQGLSGQAMKYITNGLGSGESYVGPDPIQVLMSGMQQ